MIKACSSYAKLQSLLTTIALFIAHLLQQIAFKNFCIPVGFGSFTIGRPFEV
jgi:hypothetical protein